MKLARPSRLDWAIICCSVVLARCWITGDSTLMTIAGMLVLALAGIADRLNRIEQRLQTRGRKFGHHPAKQGTVIQLI